jgi:hypothetical protein
MAVAGVVSSACPDNALALEHNQASVPGKNFRRLFIAYAYQYVMRIEEGAREGRPIPPPFFGAEVVALDRYVRQAPRLRPLSGGGIFHAANIAM